MASNADYFAVNQQAWDEMTRIHLRGSDCYPIEQFRQGRCVLREIDVREVGDVSGKRLLHLQCHFGMDTLSWARLGAKVTGVDISDEAIDLARRLACECGLDARFVRCDLYDLPHHLDEPFDIVYTSYGVLAWLGDLPAWARIVARYLKPGGRFCLLEGHPFLQVFSAADDARDFADFRVTAGYFAKGPYRFESQRSYAMEPADPSHEKTECFEWTHTIADIVNALAGAGLRIERMAEYAEHPYQQYLLPMDNTERFAGKQSLLPVVLGVLARKA